MSNRLCCPTCARPLPRARIVAPSPDTAATILSPVGRRKPGRDHVRVPVEIIFTDGEAIRLTIARHKRDSDALAIEAARRSAILFKCRSAYGLAPARDWHVLPDGRRVMSWPARDIEAMAHRVLLAQQHDTDAAALAA